MIENPRITIASETLRHLSLHEWEEAGDVLMHEGLKRLVEHGLYQAGNRKIGRVALSYLAGEAINDERLHTSIGNLQLDGPVGLAPGWDKTGKTTLAMQSIGARHKTDGAFTLFPQSGQQMPRLFTFDQQLGDRGTSVGLNRYGFYNPGVRVGAYNVERQRAVSSVTIPIIGQVTVNKKFYEPHNRQAIPIVIREAVKILAPHVDGINLGLSSPNTKGMRDAQEYGFMYENFMAAREGIEQSGADTELIGKGDGDGGEQRLETYCRLSDSTDCHWELINTTSLGQIKAKYGAESEPGGLSGADEDYQQLAVNVVKFVYEHVGDKIDIIGVGGIDGPESAFRLIRNGASAVSFNTYFREGGLKSFRNIERGLLELIDQRCPDATSLKQIIGIETDRGPKQKLKIT